MAPPLTISRANKYSNLAGQSGRQSGPGARSLLVESPGGSKRAEIPSNLKEGADKSQDLVEEGDRGSITGVSEGSITIRTCASRGLSTLDAHDDSVNNLNDKKRERSPEVYGTSIERSQDSDPIRPAKRRRKVQAVEDPYSVPSSSPIKPANNRGRRSLVNTSSKNPLSKKRNLPLSQKDEIKDSYEASGTPESSKFSRVAVEIPVYEHFNRDAYAIVSVSSTQSTLLSQLATSYPISRAERHPSPCQFGEIIIPDSQDPPGGPSTESSKCDAVRRVSQDRPETCIPDSSNLEDKGLISPKIGTAHSDPSVEHSSVPNSTESWQAAQIVPPLDISASQTSPAASDFEIFQDAFENLNSVSQQEWSQDTSKGSILSQRDTNSQCSKNSKDSVEDEPSILPKRPSSLHSSVPYNLESSGSNLSSRPQTPSRSGMADSIAASATSKMSFAELASQARDRVRARFETHVATNVDPLSLSPMPNISHQMLPVRGNATGMSPVASMEEKPEYDEQQTETPEITLDLPPMNSNDHVVLLPLAARVRNVYMGTITKYRRKITAFVNSDGSDPELLQQMDAMIEQLKPLSDHQDLITDRASSQSELSDEEEAKWAITCSTKCFFLQCLLDSLREEEKHVAILARPGQMLDILEAILKFYSFIYERPDRQSQSSSSATGPLRVTLLPTGLNDGEYVVSRADAVIAFDETFHLSERYSRVLRAHPNEHRTLSPLISLVVINSAEHLDFCLPKFNETVERKKCLVNFIVQKREKLGDLDEGMSAPRQAAEAIAEYLRFDGAKWPLVQNPDITGLDRVNLNQYQQIQSGLLRRLQNQEPLPVVASPGPTKRTLRAGSIAGPDVESTKRMRMTPTGGVLASSGDVTRVSDSIGQWTQVPSSVKRDMTSEGAAKVAALDEGQLAPVSLLLERVDKLEVELQHKQNTEEQLRSMVRSLEARLYDHVSTIKKLEPKLRQATADRRKFQVERDTAKSQEAALTQSIEARINEIAKLKEDKVNAERELGTARIALTNSAVPEVAQLAKTEEQLRTLQADKERLEKRISNMQKDFEFTRDSYQKASSYTTELRNEVLELQEQNTILLRKASENSIRVAEIQRASEATDREERIDELEALLRDRDQELRKKTEELKIKTNGRRETRGTSVPRSPRMGSGAMSPRPRFAQPAGGSRGGSPAPGDAREGFRDAALFPSSALASARWNHLNDR